jgi:hypothetical protein
MPPPCDPDQILRALVCFFSHGAFQSEMGRTDPDRENRTSAIATRIQAIEEIPYPCRAEPHISLETLGLVPLTVSPAPPRRSRRTLNAYRARSKV